MSNKKKPRPSQKRRAFERDNDSLREQIATLKAEHAQAIKAKNAALEEARRGLIFELSSTFPHLRDLITELNRAHNSTSPLRSPTSSTGHTSRTPWPDEVAASTGSERNRIESIDHDLEELASRIRAQFTHRDTGPIDDVYRPQCWEPHCPTRATFQAFDRTECITCGQPFGRYKPANDLTRSKDLRCGTRGCPGRNKVNQCVHSWQKMDTVDASAS